jgi:hypothetical protein
MAGAQKKQFAIRYGQRVEIFKQPEYEQRSDGCTHGPTPDYFRQRE